MTGSIVTALTVLAAIGSGLMAGLFFVFSNFAMSALGRLPSEQGMAAMQSINITILNPYFFTAFFGTAIIAIALIGACFLYGGVAGGPWLLTGAALYLAGIILVTIVFNVPLNNELAAATPGSAEGAAIWARYLEDWVRWNHLRTASGIAALACFVMAMR